jgi:hypothetical protein
MAGLRTNALVSIGAAGFVVFSTTVAGDNSPTRVAAQIVSGIGFLGAGVILREGININGLNTAATLWCSAMVGTFAGAGQLLASVLAGAFVVGTNLLLRSIVRLINKQPLGAIESDQRGVCASTYLAPVLVSTLVVGLAEMATRRRSQRSPPRPLGSRSSIRLSPVMLANIPVVMAGDRIGNRLPIRTIRVIAALVFAALGIFTLVRAHVEF